VYLGDLGGLGEHRDGLALSAEELMIIRVARSDIGTVARSRGRTYITGTTTEHERARVWMGPQSYQSLRDAVRKDGEVWCDVPPEQVVKPSGRTLRHDRMTQAAAAADKPGSLTGTVVLVDVGDDGERLYVIPESWARSELRSYATLRFARSYRDVLADDAAVKTVVDAIGRLLEDADEGLTERELFEQRVAGDAPFDAEDFFGLEGWRRWCPSPEESSAGFAEDNAPALWSRFRQLDGGWGIDYDPSDFLPAKDQEQILAELRVLGCEILPCPGLVRMYQDPAPDLAARIDAGEWPPRPRESPRSAQQR